MIFFDFFSSSFFDFSDDFFCYEKQDFCLLLGFFNFLWQGKRKERNLVQVLLLKGFLHAKFHGRIFTADILLGLMKGRDGIHLKSTKEVKINEE